MKQQLVFDTTDATTIAHSDSLGAFLRSADGTLLTHTDVGGKKALDVRVAEGINVEVDLSHVDDSVKIGDGTDFLAVNADGSLNAVVTATNLDIRDLTHVSDSVKIGDGTDFLAVNADGSINVVSASDNALANTAIAAAAKNCTDTASDVVASVLASRKYLFLRNFGNKRVYIGESGVTEAAGFPLDPGSVIEMRAGAAIDIEMITSAGDTIATRALQLS